MRATRLRACASRVVEFVDNTCYSYHVDHTPPFDYDFDVYATDQDKTHCHTSSDVSTNRYSLLVISVISGVRASGDKTTPASAATDLVFTTLTIAAYTLFGFDLEGREETSNLDVVRP